jgi:hypothetical protein
MQVRVQQIDRQVDVADEHDRVAVSRGLGNEVHGSLARSARLVFLNTGRANGPASSSVISRASVARALPKIIFTAGSSICQSSRGVSTAIKGNIGEEKTARRCTNSFTLGSD